MILPLFLIAAALCAQEKRIGAVDFFGYEGTDLDAVRKSLPDRNRFGGSEKTVSRVLSSSSDAKHHAVATLMGYVRQSRGQLAGLVNASFDADATVRNNAKHAAALFQIAAWQSNGHAQPARTVLERTGALPGFEKEEIATGLDVVYAVTTADVNGDKKLDIVAINNSQLLWFENPTWTKHVVVENVTKADNVAIAPRDINGDGKLDFALGADWQSTNTASGGSLHWVSGAGRVTNIATEPTLHRIGWADVDRDGRAELIVVPLHGKGTKAPDWTAGPGARILVFRVPSDPAKEPWPVEVADDSLHIVHNFISVGPEIWTASAEGVHALRRDASGKWSKRLIAEGKPGEIKLGRAGNARHLATVEPWHGNSVVVYEESGSAWKRTVIETNLNQAHALAWADLDGDGNDELVVGWRGKPWGLAYYQLREGNWVKLPIDDGVAVEDVTVADLNGDGRPEIIAGGRTTGNIRIYRTTTTRK